jgi:hypothetical protein
VIALLLLAPLLGGCSQPKAGRLELFPATGQVLFQGEPAEGVLVVLNPADGTPAAGAGLAPSGTTDADGVFVIFTYPDFEGAPEGKYRMTLQWLQPAKATANGPPAGFAPLVDRFAGRYRDPGTSPWAVTIMQEDNEIDSVHID